LDEEKSIHARLAQQNGFGPAFLYNAQQSIKLAEEEHNKYDLTAALCF
jgi:hypothetical protein